MTNPRITIIGLGLIGSSLGLALKASNKTIHIVGNDIDHGLSKQAQKKGAVDKSTINLPNACQDADLVIIATPITAIRETLEVIGPHLKEGCVVTDTATLKEPVLAWAAETLPAGIAFVGGDPVLNPAAQPTDFEATQGLELARADLFHNALYTVCPAVTAAPTAVKRVTDMVQLIQARPFFLDPTEHDGLRAAVDGLPALTSLALMSGAAESPGWREARKLADYAFGMATAPLTDNAEAQRAQTLLNADHLLPRLDNLIVDLKRLREWMAAQDATALEEAFESAVWARNSWLIARARAEWEEDSAKVDMPGASGALGSLFGFGRRRKPGDEEK
jgi:prephenate dehydrogenase